MDCSPPGSSVHGNLQARILEAVLNDLGYEIVYDFENNLYVIGLGSQLKYDKALEQVINKDVPYYYQNFVNSANLKLTYDLGMHKKGWYTVAHDDYRILYNQDKNIYVVETEAVRKELLNSNFFGEPNPDYDANFDCPVHSEGNSNGVCAKKEGHAICPAIEYVTPNVYPRYYVSNNGFTFVFDLDTARYC